MKKTKMLAMAVIMSLSVFSYSVINAECNDEMKGFHKVHNAAYDVDVSIKNGVDIDQTSITNILSKVSETDRENVTIFTVEKSQPEKKIEKNKKNPNATRGSSFHYSKYIVNDSYMTDQRQLISVAKGMTSTLSSEVTLNKNINVTGSVEVEYIDFIKGKIESEFGTGISETISTTRKFVGPPENSKHNSRSYYAAIMNEVGYCQQPTTYRSGGL